MNNLQASSGLKIWKTLKLDGRLNTADELRERLSSNDLVGPYASQLLGHPDFRVVHDPMELDLVVLSVRQLGFSKWVTRQQIYDRAMMHGLKLCPSEVGPQLCAQQWRIRRLSLTSKTLFIGMEPILCVDGRPGGTLAVFTLEYPLLRERTWLGAMFADPHSLWGGSNKWVFVLPRQ